MKINLLPWRSLERKQKQRTILIIIMISIVAISLSLFGCYWLWQAWQEEKSNALKQQQQYQKLLTQQTLPAKQPENMLTKIETALTTTMLQTQADGNLSLNYTEAPVRQVLQMLAEKAGKNMVISDSVQGNISLRLHNVSWQEALNTVLLMQNLVSKQQANVLFITANDTLNPSLMSSAVLLKLRYAKAADIATIMQAPNAGVLSKAGSVNADPRTNSLWIQDAPARMATIRNYVAQLDVPVKQVAIKARIVNVDNSCLRELGIKFGTVNLANTVLQNGLQMDMPAPAANQNGRFNIAIASLGPNTLLDLELSALESEGHGKIISSPEVITADRTAAYIEAGEEVPYQERTGQNVTSVAFKKAVLGLKVTPQILAQDRILLNLTVNQDRLTQLLFHGVPAIQTREIQTQVSVRNGETIVLGGIYEESNSDNTERLPFISNVPVVGKFFTSNATRHERRELLIFVTPQIVE